jgi:hypothetical protein
MVRASGRVGALEKMCVRAILPEVRMTGNQVVHFVCRSGRENTITELTDNIGSAAVTFTTVPGPHLPINFFTAAAAGGVTGSFPTGTMNTGAWPGADTLQQDGTSQNLQFQWPV